MPKTYIKIFNDTLDMIEPLDDSERGRLFTALLHYSVTGEVMDLRGNERFLFPSFRRQLDRDDKAYEAKVARNRENGKNGGRPKNPENPVG